MQACTAGGLCGEDSQARTLRPPLSFWCPQRSQWKARHGGSKGRPAPGVRFSATTAAGTPVRTGAFRASTVSGTRLSALAWLQLPARSGTTGQPQQHLGIADGVPLRSDRRASRLHLYITGGARTTWSSGRTVAATTSSSGRILIDPDGYVFDVTRASIRSIRRRMPFRVLP